MAQPLRAKQVQQYFADYAHAELFYRVVCELLAQLQNIEHALFDTLFDFGRVVSFGGQWVVSELKKREGAHLALQKCQCPRLRHLISEGVWSKIVPGEYDTGWMIGRLLSRQGVAEFRCVLWQKEFELCPLSGPRDILVKPCLVILEPVRGLYANPNHLAFLRPRLGFRIVPWSGEDETTKMQGPTVLVGSSFSNKVSKLVGLEPFFIIRRRGSIIKTKDAGRAEPFPRWRHWGVEAENMHAHAALVTDDAVCLPCSPSAFVAGVRRVGLSRRLRLGSRRQRA